MIPAVIPRSGPTNWNGTRLRGRQDRLPKDLQSSKLQCGIITGSRRSKITETFFLFLRQLFTIFPEIRHNQVGLTLVFACG